MKRMMIPVLAIIVFKLVLASPAYAITEADNKNQDLVSKFASSLGVKTEGTQIKTMADLRKYLSGLLSLVEFDKKLKDWVAKRQAAEEKRDGAEEALKLIPQAKEIQRQKDESKIANIEAGIANISGRPSPSKGQMDLDDSDGCPTQNLSQLTNIGSFLDSGVFEKDATAIKEELEGRLEEEAVLATVEAAKNLKEQKKKKKEKQATGEDLAKLLKDIHTKGPIDREKVIGDLKEQTQTLNNEAEALDDKLIDESAELFKATAKAKKEKKKIARIAAKWANMVKGFMQSAHAIAKKGIDAQRTECKDTDRELPNLVRQAIQVGQDNQISPEEINSAIEQVEKASCTISSSEVDNTFGAPAQSAVNAIASQTDFAALLSNVVEVTDRLKVGINNTIIQANSAHKKCQRIKKEEKALKKFIQQYTSQEGGTGERGRGNRRLARARNGQGGRGGRQGGQHSRR